MYTAIILMMGMIIGYIVRDFMLYIKNDPAKQASDESVNLKEVATPKEGEYQPIWIKIDKNDMGGYSSMVYNRHGTHLTKENREHFVNILNLMITRENELRSHQFKLYTFNKDK